MKTTTIDSDVDVDRLWKEYARFKTDALRNQLASIYSGLVRKIAKYYPNKAKVKFVGYDQIIAAGYFGLLRAIPCFNPDFGTKFETYASKQIRGQMIRWVNKTCLYPRRPNYFEDVPSLDKLPCRKCLEPIDQLVQGESFDEIIICLKEIEQIVIILHYKHGYKINEVATYLEIPDYACWKIHQSALRKMRDSFFLD